MRIDQEQGTQGLTRVKKIKKVRKVINTAIELARNEKKLGSSLEADVVLVTKENNLCVE